MASLLPTTTSECGCTAWPSRVAFSAAGVGFLRNGEPIVNRAVKFDLLTTAAVYSWNNTKPAWGTGYVDLAANKIYVEVYLH